MMPKFLSLKYKLLIFSILLSALLMIFLSLIEIRYDIAEYKTLVKKEFSWFKERQLSYLAQKIWAMEYADLKKYAENEVQEKWFGAISIYDIQGGLIASAGDKTSNIHEEKFNITYNHNNKNTVIGSVSLSANTPLFRDVIKKRWVSVFILNVLLVLSIFICFYLFLNKLVLSRIQQIISETQDKKRFDRLEGKSVQAKSKLRDEIDLLIGALNHRSKELFHELARRKKMEESLNFQALILNSIQDHVTATDIEGNILYVNKAKAEAIKRPINELLNQSVDIFGRDETSRATQRELVKKTLRFGKWRSEVVDYTADGNVLILDCRTQLIKDSEGNPWRLVGISTDITKRKANEDKLIEQKQEIESVFRSAPVGIGLRSDSVLIKVNSELEKITGYSSNELIGKNARILYPSDEDYQYVVAEKYRQISLYGTGTVETKWQRKDGKVVDILLSSTPIDLSDYSKGVTFSALDITESKMNAQALLDSEEKYRTMMEVQEDPTYISSSDMRIEYMNPAMIEWVGEDAYGKKCHEAIWQRQTKCPWCLFDKVIHGETAVRELQSPISEEIFHIMSAPIRHPDGSISKLTSYRNVTEIKTLNTRLQQAQKMEAIGNLAGGIAHDFNNILFPIIGMSEMLIEDFPPDSIEHQNAQEIYKAGIRGSELIKQILAFSRQDENKLFPTRLQFVMKEVFKLTRASIPSNIELNQSFQRDCGLVLADSTQLHQIGMNLITNAYHAVQEKSGKIDVDVREIEVKSGLNDVNLPPGRYATLTVADNGVGIHQEKIGKIFEPYFTTKEKGKGTGLGLSVVYGIVKRYKGDIKVMSEPGRGTSFQVYLPVLDSPGTEKTEDKILPQPEGNENILFVDDEAPIANLQKQILKKLGYSVSVRTSSIEALEAFKTTPEAYDLVISDMSMPQMTGDRLAVEILKIRPDIPIIICTGFSERIGKERALKMGIKGFLTKPLIKADLAKEVRRVLDGGDTIL